MELYQERTRIVRYPEGDLSLEKNYKKYPVTQSRVVHYVRQDEDILDISYKYYLDEKLWYVIAFDNDIINPFDLTVGSIIYIPYSNV